MIQRAVTAIIGVVIGLFATFAVFGAILGGLDNFYLLTQDACMGEDEDPQRFLRVAIETAGTITWQHPSATTCTSRPGITQSDIDETTSPEDINWETCLYRGATQFP